MLGERKKEPFTGFNRQFSLWKNIHARLVNCLGKSMKNRSLGLSRCLQEGGNHRMLEKTRTPGGTWSNPTWEVWDSLCLVNIHNPASMAASPRGSSCEALLWTKAAPEAVLFRILLLSRCCNVYQSIEFPIQVGPKKYTGQRSTRLSHSLMFPEWKFSFLFLHCSW